MTQQDGRTKSIFSRWKLWVNANKKENALKVYKWVLGYMKCDATLISIEPYHKGGFVIEYHIPLMSINWNDAVVEVIELGQRFAHSWYLLGDVRERPNAIANKTSVSGVDMAEWELLLEGGA